MDKVKVWFKTYKRIEVTDDDENPTYREEGKMNVETMDYNVEFLRDWVGMKSVQHGEDGGSFDVVCITNMDDSIIDGWKGMVK